jgi:hypothetical protein
MVTEKPQADKQVAEHSAKGKKADKTATSQNSKDNTNNLLKTEIALFTTADQSKETYVPSLPDLFVTLKDIDSIAIPVSGDHGAKKLFERFKIMSGMGLGFQGFDPSKEGADMILDGKTDSKTAFAYNYSRIHRLDERHRKAVTAIMELAIGIGMPTSPRSRVITQMAMQKLQEAVGPDIAQDILGDLQSLQATFAYNKPELPELNLTITGRDALLQQVINTATKEDPVMNHIKVQLAKYNSHTQFTQNSAKVIETALNIAGFVPTLVAPIAGLSNFAFTSATGGPEQEKLLREVYLAKSMEDRQKVIEDDAHLIFDTYLMAIASNNATLFSCSRSLLNQLCGPNDDVVCQVFGGSPPIAKPKKQFAPYTPSAAFQPSANTASQFKPAM